MSISYPPTLVSGPVNIIRVEGEIGGIKKILYLYGDIHIPIQEQTECNDPINSLPIAQHLIYMFKACHQNKPDNKYDFFVEYHPIFPVMDWGYGHPSMHIENVLKLAKDSFSIDKETAKIIRKDVKIVDNVRTHYTDFRAISIPQSLSIIHRGLNNITGTPAMYLTSQQVIMIKESLLPFAIFTNIIQKVLVKGIDPNSDLELKKDIDWLYDGINNFSVVTRDYISKIRNKYQHEQVKNKILEILTGHYDKLLQRRRKSLSESFTEADTFINDPVFQDERYLRVKVKTDELFGIIYRKGGRTDEQTSKLQTYINKVDDLLETIKTDPHQMDIYFLMRFLDKTYVGTGILYSGIAHSMNIIIYLIKYFNFRVTHASHHSIPIEEINQKVPSMFYYMELGEYLFPPVKLQCCDMSHFPKFYE